MVYLMLYLMKITWKFTIGGEFSQWITNLSARKNSLRAMWETSFNECIGRLKHLFRTRVFENCWSGSSMMVVNVHISLDNIVNERYCISHSNIRNNLIFAIFYHGMLSSFRSRVRYDAGGLARYTRGGGTRSRSAQRREERPAHRRARHN